MMALAGERGNDYLYKKLVNIDPAAAGKILPGNLRRIIRALEIHEVTKQMPSSIQRKGMPLFPILVVGLDLPRTAFIRQLTAELMT
jgi:tRNA dimethylallyltransferase